MASAPAKVILVGEHFVVKGARAVAVSIGLRAYTRVRSKSAWPALVRSAGLGVEAAIDADGSFRGAGELRPVSRIVEALAGLGYSVRPFEAIIDSEIPPAAGLGSSAATSASFALALSAQLGSPLDPDELSRVTYEAEVLVHGRPSGIDNTVVVFGGGIVYRRGSPPQRIPATLPAGHRLVVADSGLKRNTGDVVARVLSNAELLWPAASKLYEAADALTDIVLEALRAGDAVKLGAAFNLAHGMLHALGASSEALDALVHAARGAGALGAKLTGAGAGGCVIALAPPGRIERVVEALARRARWVRAVELGVGGARLEETKYI